MNGTLTDIVGIRVGHQTHSQAGTGCTVILVPPETRAGVVVRGGGPGTRELELLDPVRSVPFIDAILLTGGSAFGLAAADGVMKWLEERGIGYATPWAVVPIVPAAVLYDLFLSSPKTRPNAEDGYAACSAATDAAVQMGSVGAGTGATVGKWGGLSSAMKGGVGSVSVRLEGGVTVAALVVTNAVGDVIERRTGQVLAGARNPSGAGFRSQGNDFFEYTLPDVDTPVIENTTLCVVATDASYTKSDLNMLANMAHNGLARAINPVNTQHDGDIVFALSCGKRQAPLFTVGSAAADMVQTAIEASVRNAVSHYGIPGLGG